MVHPSVVSSPHQHHHRLQALHGDAGAPRLTAGRRPGRYRLPRTVRYAKPRPSTAQPSQPSSPHLRDCHARTAPQAPPTLPRRPPADGTRSGARSPGRAAIAQQATRRSASAAVLCPHPHNRERLSCAEKRPRGATRTAARLRPPRPPQDPPSRPSVQGVGSLLGAAVPVLDRQPGPGMPDQEPALGPIRRFGRRSNAPGPIPQPRAARRAHL